MFFFHSRYEVNVKYFVTEPLHIIIGRTSFDAGLSANITKYKVQILRGHDFALPSVKYEFLLLICSLFNYV